MMHSLGHGLTLLWQIMEGLNIVLSDLLSYGNKQIVIVIKIKAVCERLNNLSYIIIIIASNTIS